MKRTKRTRVVECLATLTSSWVSVPFVSIRVAPIFPVSDLRAALAFYQRLGFEVRPWRGGGYGFVTLDDVEIHLGVEPDLAARADRHATAYLFVEDADALAQTWLAAGADVRSPQDTEWGQHEGALIDPDGNVIRFGSAISTAKEKS